MSLPLVPTDNISSKRHTYLLARAVNALILGRGRNVGTFTLTENVASSTITDNQFESTMVPIIVPTTANAAAEIAAGTMYLSARANGSFTFTHANNAQTDRTFLYVRRG